MQSSLGLAVHVGILVVKGLCAVHIIVEVILTIIVVPAVHC